MPNRAAGPPFLVGAGSRLGYYRPIQGSGYMTDYQDQSVTAPDRADNMLGRMTKAEKTAQMTQVEKNSIRPEDGAALGIGSILSGGGGHPTPNTPATWAGMVGDYL